MSVSGRVRVSVVMVVMMVVAQAVVRLGVAMAGSRILNLLLLVEIGENEQGGRLPHRVGGGIGAAEEGG